MIDPRRIADAIMSCGVDSPMARETGAALVDKWIEHHAHEDAQLKPIHVEAGFLVWLDENTAAIGVQDAVFEDPAGVLGGEWKTHKEPKVKRDGGVWATDTEETWLRDISTGPQLAIYALALNRGTYFEKGFKPVRFEIREPRIMVRAAIKSNPIQFWPTEESGIFQFPEAMLDDITEGLLAKAHTIRALRHAGHIPWQLPGKQCFPFNPTLDPSKRKCPFYDPLCSQHLHPMEGFKGIFDPNDPAATFALPNIPEEKREDPNLIVLSASQYQTASECLEKHRLINYALAGKEESLALDTGSAMHAGLAEYYRQLREHVKVT